MQVDAAFFVLFKKKNYLKQFLTKKIYIYLRAKLNCIQLNTRDTHTQKKNILHYILIHESPVTNKHHDLEYKLK